MKGQLNHMRGLPYIAFDILNATFLYNENHEPQSYRQVDNI